MQYLLDSVFYNSNRQKKEYEKAIVVAESHYAKGELEAARSEYINALRFRPTEQEAISKINELNIKLGIGPETQKTDTIKPVESLPSKVPVDIPSASTDINQYGVFANAALGENEFITLENNKVELKISLKGGRVYSARLKDYRTYDSLPLILFSGDSTVFGFNFFTSDNKAVQTNNLFFKPVSERRAYTVTSEPQSVRLRLLASDDKYIEYKYTLAPDKYMVDFDVAFKSMESIISFKPKQPDIRLEDVYTPTGKRKR